LLALLIITFCFGITIASYQDARYNYSIFNHFISELGHTQGSPYYFLFSFALCSAGICCAILLSGLHVMLQSKLSLVGLFFGLGSSLACFLVGVFPADTQLGPHLVAALVFFVGNLITAGLFSLAIVRSSPKISIQYAIPGFIVCITGLIFLSLPTETVVDFLKNRATYLRPDFWINAIFEWLVFFSLMIWICMISLLIHRHNTNNTNDTTATT
jgi:hypothetical membrane protein